MSSPRPIVSATDFSAPARHAASRAAMLAAGTGTSLSLVHAVGGAALDDLRRWLGDSDARTGALQDDARRQLAAQAEELARRHGIAVATELVVGHPVAEITRLATDLDATLVVTATRGAGFFRGLVFGSTAERVAARSSRPVLLVRQLPHEPYRRVLVPVDFSAWSRGAIDLARAVAPQATLVLMHAVDAPYEGKLRLAGVDDDVARRYLDAARQEARQRLHALVADAGLAAGESVVATPNGGDPWMLIVQQEQEHDCDLVVIGRQGRHAFDEALLGSTTRMVITEGAADVLISSRRSG